MLWALYQEPFTVDNGSPMFCDAVPLGAFIFILCRRTTAKKITMKTGGLGLMSSTPSTIPEREQLGFLTHGAPLRTWCACMPWLLAIAACNILLLVANGHCGDLG